MKLEKGIVYINPSNELYYIINDISGDKIKFNFGSTLKDALKNANYTVWGNEDLRYATWKKYLVLSRLAKIYYGL